MNLRFVLPLMAGLGATSLPAQTNSPATIRKVEDIVIYRNDQFYSAFPSVVRRADGELMVAFRRAPERRLLGEKNTSHTDPNSQLVLVRSGDGGRTWSREPELIYAHPFGGSQDPCLVQLHEGTLICASYGWALLDPDYITRQTNTLRHGNFGFLGGYVLRSKDGGQSWQGPFLPPPIATSDTTDIFGQPLPSYNRGAMCEGKDGQLYWVTAARAKADASRTENHLLVSSDQGRTWNYSALVATDAKVTFNEASLYETPRGDLVAFLRTANFDDHTAMSRSTNGGKSFLPWQDAGFQGHPHYALRLPDNRVLLVYGYRHAPFGVRARVLDPECNQIKGTDEIVLRTDGGNFDLGYPWAVMLSPNRVLVVYYFNQANGTRYIAGTVLEIE